MFASPAAVTLHTINIPEIFRKFTVFLVSVCVTVNREHWSQYFLALNWCNRTSTVPWGVRNKVSHGDAPSRGSTPYPFIQGVPPRVFSAEAFGYQRCLYHKKRGTSDTHLPNEHEHYTSDFARCASCPQDVSIGYWWGNLPFAFISFPLPPTPPPPPHTHTWSCHARKTVWLWLKLQTQYTC